MTVTAIVRSVRTECILFLKRTCAF